MAENKAVQPRVSVIVPVYRTEPYLERCCRSLFGQTLQEVEYLFMLDGPSAEAESIIGRTLTDFPQRKEWVRIIGHEQNRGVSCCRQGGHDLARGQYLFHCDSDDWMEVEALEKLYAKAVAEGAELVFADYVRHYPSSGREVVYSAEYVLRGGISTMDGTLCNKLISRELVQDNDLRFPEGINWGEDMVMSVLLQIFARKTAYLPQIFYHYCMRSDSLTQALDTEKYMQLVSCPAYVERVLSQRGLAESHQMLLMQMKFEVKEYFLIHRAMRNVKKWQRIYPECHAYIWQYGSVPLYLKCVSALASHRLPILAWAMLQCRDGYVWVRDHIVR